MVQRFLTGINEMAAEDFDGVIDVTPDWDVDIPQLSNRAWAIGGPNGAMNAQAKAIAAKLKALHSFDPNKGISLVGFNPGVPGAIPHCTKI